MATPGPERFDIRGERERDVDRDRADALLLSMGELVAAHNDRRRALEWEVVGAVLSAPLPGRARAVEAGLSCAHFDRDDLRLIYAAVLVAADRGKDATVKLAYQVLRHANLIDTPADEASDRCTGKPFSIPLLARLATSHPDASATTRLATQLIDLHRRGELARDCWRCMKRLLTPDADTLGAVVIAPLRVGRKS